MQEKQKKIKRLHPCPFCGGSAEVYSSYDNPDIFHVKCDMCYARSGWYRDAEDAKAAWNRRPDND